MKPSTATVVRCALLIIALINMALVTAGIVPEEIVGDSRAYELGSYVITAVIGLVAAWKNNSFTSAAIQADEYMKSLKAGESEKGSEA